jgi:peptidyl-prolyl cis-trans isomerase B (cyclophilin B)
VGTAKRERQKANRQLKYEQLERQQQRQKAKRRGIQLAIIIPLAVALGVGLILLLGGDDDTDVAATTVPATTVPGTETTVTPTETTAAPTTTLAGLPCPAEDGSSPQTRTFPAPPPMCIDVTKVYEATIVTNKGEFTIDLDPGLAPTAVNNFVYLARYQYFNDTNCHRIIPGFVVQCGDPTGTGSGGPGYRFADELPAAGAYQLGSVAMANSGANTNGSQFFIVTGDRGVQLPPLYTLFGQVGEGFDTTVKAMEAVGNEETGAPSEDVTILTVTIAVKEGAVPTPPTTAAPTTVAGATSVAPTSSGG